MISPCVDQMVNARTAAMKSIPHTPHAVHVTGRAILLRRAAARTPALAARASILKTDSTETSMITVTAFTWVPPFAQGKVRDLRVRWALEEAGLSYRTRLLNQGDQDQAEYRALQPFGQVPILEENGQTLFESGAIVLHIAERSEVLLPKEAGARARATQWLIAALNSIEPCIMTLASIDFFYFEQEWAKLRRPSALAFVQHRLSSLANALGDKPYLDGARFTAGDLIMTTVLRTLPDLVVDRALVDYVERCTARPAFLRALTAQMADFKQVA
jgi:glutathione S-transferase